MRFHNTSFLPLVIFGAVLLVCNNVEARRIRVRPQEDQDDAEYYEAEPQDSQEQRVVYISAADQYNGLYGQPSSASSRSSQPNYIQQDARAAGLSGAAKIARTKEPTKSPPVQTIRNYNKVNDDGSFTFGYEAADGSFKEETRGTDCVVRGKYGYVDPDGNKREFTYVSGNPCDPNAPKEDDQERDSDRAREQEDSNESDNIPNYPTRPIRPIRPLIATTPAPKTPVTLFQNNYVRDEEDDDDVESEAVLRPQPIQPVRNRPIYIPRPQYVVPETATETSTATAYRPSSHHLFSAIPSSTPSSLIYKNTLTPLNITPRPVAPVTTYRPQTLQYAPVTPKPASSQLYTKPIATYSTPPRPIAAYTPPKPIYTYTTPATFTPSSRTTNIDFDAEFSKFQQENNVVVVAQPTPTTSLPKAVTKPVTGANKIVNTAPSATSGPIYSSALLYDPSSGQYNTQLYQTLPQTEGDFTLKQKIQPYVHRPQPQVVNFQQLAQQSPLYNKPQTRPSTNQALYQQQQSELQFQNSAQLYAQQAKARQQQQQQQQPQQAQVYQQPLQQQSSPQQFYYIQPQPSYTAGSQIDAFLRGHNIQF